MGKSMFVVVVAVGVLMVLVLVPTAFSADTAPAPSTTAAAVPATTNNVPPGSAAPSSSATAVSAAQDTQAAPASLWQLQAQLDAAEKAADDAAQKYAADLAMIKKTIDGLRKRVAALQANSIRAPTTPTTLPAVASAPATSLPKESPVPASEPPAIVILDTYHGIPLPGVTDLVELKGAQSLPFEIRPMKSLLTDELLAKTRVLVIAGVTSFTTFNTFSEQEIKAVEKFLADGGGLLCAGQAWSWVYPSYGNKPINEFPLNVLGKQLGFFITGEALGDAILLSTDITSDIHRIEQNNWNPSEIQFTSPDYVPFLQDNNSRVIAAYTRHGKGRLVLVGHEGLFKGNPRLLRSVLAFLAFGARSSTARVPSPAAQPTQVQTPPSERVTKPAQTQTDRRAETSEKWLNPVITVLSAKFGTQQKFIDVTDRQKQAQERLQGSPFHAGYDCITGYNVVSDPAPGVAKTLELECVINGNTVRKTLQHDEVWLPQDIPQGGVQMPWAGQDFKILRAFYGTDDRWADVTDEVAKVVTDSVKPVTYIEGILPYGVNPAPAIQKKFVVIWSHNGKACWRVFDQGMTGRLEPQNAK